MLQSVGWKLQVKMHFDDLLNCIQVYKDGQVLQTYTDNNAAFYDRSYQMPTSPVQVFEINLCVLMSYEAEGCSVQ